MIVTSSTRNGQAKEASRDNVDLVVDNVVGIAELHANRKKAQRRELLSVISETKLIGGELLGDKLIVGQVSIERVDDVVAVRVGKRKLFKSDRRTTVRVGVPSDIQPMPTPMLAVSPRFEESIDNSCKSVWR